MEAAKIRAKEDEYSYLNMPTFIKVVFNSGTISFHLSDKRMITIPLSWSEKLFNSTKEVRENYIIRSHFVFWDSIDEIIGVKNLLNGSIVPKKVNTITIRAIKASREGKVTKTKDVADLIQKLKS